MHPSPSRGRGCGFRESAACKSRGSAQHRLEGEPQPTMAYSRRNMLLAEGGTRGSGPTNGNKPYLGTFQRRLAGTRRIARSSRATLTYLAPTSGLPLGLGIHPELASAHHDVVRDVVHSALAAFPQRRHWSFTTSRRLEEGHTYTS